MSASPAKSDHNVIAGAFWMLITSILFVCVTGIVRYLGTNLPAVESAFIRYLIGTVMILPLLLFIEIPKLNRKEYALYGLRGLVHGGAVMLWFYAMARIPIAEVTAIGYTAPIFVTIGAALFLGERLHLRRIMAVIAGFVGTLVILRPGFQEISIGALAQLLAAPLFAASFLIAKRFTKQADPAFIVVMLSIGCTVVLAPAAIAQWRTPSLEEVLFLTLTAVFATAGHFTLTKAFAAAPITTTQPISFLQLVWAVLLGMVAFGEPLDFYVFLGGGIIVAAATYISHREARLAAAISSPPAAALKS